MHILQICKKFPYPLLDGECIAINQLTKGLKANGCEVTVAALNTKKHFTDTNKLPPEYLEQAKYESVSIDTSINLAAFIRSILKGSSYNIDRFNNSDFNNLLIKICSENEFDIIQLEGLYLSPYINTLRAHSKAKIVLRAHNIEHLIWERLSEDTINPIKKLLYNHFASRLKEIELLCINIVDAIVPISSTDALWYKEFSSNPVHSLGVGIDTHVVFNLDNKSVSKFFHIGSMDWQPNIDALTWFIENVWKEMKSKYPQIELHLAGRNFSDKLFQNIEGVIVHGEVADAHDFINQNHVMISPLFSGSGIRVKIIEAMAMGKVVIATQIAAEGIDAKPEKEILIADDANEYKVQMQKVISNNTLVTEIEEAANSFIRKNFDNFVITEKLLEFYKTL